MNTDLNTRIHRFAAWLKAGGIENVWDMNVLNEIGHMKEDNQGNVIPESIGPLARAFMNAWELGQSYGPPHRVNEMFLYPSLERKGVMIHQVNIDTKEDLQRIIEEELLRTKVLYRGVREAKWPLYTSLQRMWMTEKLSERGVEVGDFLKRLLHNARVAENGAIPEFIKGRGQDPDVDLAILSFLQHYGGSMRSTPIQDWTYSFLNSLYFAIDNLEKGASDIDAYCSVYHIEQQHIEDGNLKSTIHAVYESSKEAKAKERIDRGFAEGIDPEFMKQSIESGVFFGLMRVNYAKMLGSVDALLRMCNTVPVVFLGDQDDTECWNLSTKNNDNIINQQGVFIWNSNPSEPVENVARDFHEEDHGWSPQYRFCLCYNINKRLKTDIEEILKERGTVKPHIYPEVPVLSDGKNAEQIVQEVVRLTKKSFVKEA